MDIIINSNSKDTIYEQIIYQIKMHIAKEELKVGSNLPSIRRLSKSLQVSIISVQRAYDELQKEGIIECVPGKGCFVSTKLDKSFLKDNLLKEVEEAVEKTIITSKNNNVELDEVISLIKLLWEDSEK